MNDELDQRRGMGRALRFGKRPTPGVAEFHAGFVLGALPTPGHCELCAAGDRPIRLKRQLIHRVGGLNRACGR